MQQYGGEEDTQHDGPAEERPAPFGVRTRRGERCEQTQQRAPGEALGAHQQQRCPRHGPAAPVGTSRPQYQPLERGQQREREGQGLEAARGPGREGREERRRARREGGARARAGEPLAQHGVEPEHEHHAARTRDARHPDDQVEAEPAHERREQHPQEVAVALDRFLGPEVEAQPVSVGEVTRAPPPGARKRAGRGSLSRPGRGLARGSVLGMTWPCLARGSQPTRAREHGAAQRSGPNATRRRAGCAGRARSRPSAARTGPGRPSSRS